MKIAFLLLIFGLTISWPQMFDLPSEDKLDLFAGQFSEGLLTNDFSELMTKDSPLFSRALFKMLSIKTGSFDKAVGLTSLDEPLIKRRSFQFHAGLIEEIIFLFLKLKKPYFDLDSLKDDLHDYEVNINSETMAEFLPLLPPKSSPRVVVSVYPHSRPTLRLHGCQDPNNLSLTCFKIKLAVDVGGKDITVLAAVEFYFRNTYRFVRPFVTSLTLEPTKEPYDDKFFKIEEMTKFANKCLLVARNGINYTVSEKYEDLVPTIAKYFKTIRVKQDSDAYVIDFDLS